MFAPSKEAEESLTDWFAVGYEQCADEAVGFLQQYLEPQEDVIQGLRRHLQGRNLPQHPEWSQPEQCFGHDRQNHGAPLEFTHVSLPFDPQALALSARPSTTPSRLPHLITNGRELSSNGDISFSLCCNTLNSLFLTPPCRRNPRLSCLPQRKFQHLCNPDNKRQIVTMAQPNVSPTTDALGHHTVTETETSSSETSLLTGDDAFITSYNNDVTKSFCCETVINCDESKFDYLSANTIFELLNVQFFDGEEDEEEEGKVEERKEEEEEAKWGGNTALIDSAAELIRLAANNPKVLKLLDKLFSLMDEVELDEEEMYGECEDEKKEDDDYYKECEMEMDVSEE